MSYSDRPRCLSVAGLYRSMFWGMLVLLVWAVGAASSAHGAPDPAGVVHFASGRVTATAGSETRALAKSSELFPGDRVDTADNGRVQMRFTDGGLVSLLPNSTFSVDEYLYEGAEAEDNALVFGLLKGGLRTVTGAIGKIRHDEYELKTPVATLGIRGTEYVAVLRPANTLRVHVGRGKVVITNEQGTLEVPAGRNAIVTLGSAPAFSEQGPDYQATAPSGDRLRVGGDESPDPFLMNPRDNLPGPGVNDFNLTPSSPGPGPGPEPGSGGYITGGAAYPGLSLPPGTNQSPPVPLFVHANDDVDPGSWTFVPAGSSGALTWGEYTDGTGTLAGTPYTLTALDDLPVVFSNVPAPLAPSGTLSFALEGATPVKGSWSSGSLDAFDLGIHLSNLQYDMNFQMTTTEGQFNATETNASLNPGSGAGGFSFGSSNVTTPAGGCSVCNIEVQGFLAGSNAEQAGVSFEVQTNDDVVNGAAALRAVP